MDSHDAGQCARVRRFVFGYSLNKDGRVYRYPGFVERDGVRYLGQSVLFITVTGLPDLVAFLRKEGVDHAVTTAWLGAIMPS
ncbi:MAG: hypothetical protein WC985_01100 [Thermoplasmata archaeon]